MADGAAIMPTIAWWNRCPLHPSPDAPPAVAVPGSPVLTPPTAPPLPSPPESSIPAGPPYPGVHPLPYPPSVAFPPPPVVDSLPPMAYYQRWHDDGWLRERYFRSESDLDRFHLLRTDALDALDIDPRKRDAS